MDGEARQKLQARRFNEHLKLLVTTFNAVSLVIFSAGVLQPLVVIGTSRAVAISWYLDSA